MNPQQTQQIDNDVKNLVSAMGRVESPGEGPQTYKVRGASGEYGRYQFMPDTWRQWSAESGISTPLEQSSIEEQNKVAYNKVKAWKDAGLNPAQIASKWNSGDENAYKNNHVGVNSQGVPYNTPEHVRKVSEQYQKLKGLGGSYTPPPPTTAFQPAQQSGVETLTDQIGAGGGFAKDLGGVFNTAAAKGSDAMQRGFHSETDPFSALYQTAGAGAGAIGDTVDATLKNLPLVGGLYEGATDLIGGAVSGAMNTASGQKAKEAFESLSPDTQRNIGATLDIASIFPIFKAFKLGKKGLSDSMTGLNETKVVNKATDEIEGGLSKEASRSLDRAKSRGLNPVKTILDEPKYIPDIIEQNGKYIYDTKQQAQALQKSIEADELALQNLFESTIKQNVGVNLNDVRATVLKDILPKGKINLNSSAIARTVNKVFDNIASSGGRNYISLSDLNQIKREVRGNINFGAKDPFRALARGVEADIGHSLMNQVEAIAKKAGIKEVKEINQSMGTKLTALDILEDLGGKAIKSGAKGKEGLIKSVAKTIPGVEGIVDYASRGVPTTPTQRLARRSPIRQTGLKGLTQLGGGLALSGQLTERE